MRVSITWNIYTVGSGELGKGISVWIMRYALRVNRIYKKSETDVGTAGNGNRMRKRKKGRVRDADKNFVSGLWPFHTTPQSPHTLDVMCFGRGRFEADARIMSSWTVGYWHATYKDERSRRKIDASAGIDEPRARAQLLFVSRDPGSDSRWLQDAPLYYSGARQGDTIERRQ